MIKKLLQIIIVFAITIAFSVANTASAIGNRIPPEIVGSSRIIAKLADSADAHKLLSYYGARNIKKLGALNSYSIVVNPLSENMIDNLLDDPSVIGIENDIKAQIDYLPNDPLLAFQDYLVDSKITSAWDYNKGSSNIVVAVVDTGVDYLHEDLKNKMWTNSQGYYGYDFVYEDNSPMDDHSHGTAVAGIVGASTNNSIGIAGGANVKIMAVKSMLDTGEGFISDITRGIIYATDNGADIINLSLGIPESSTALDEAVEYAYEKGALVIAATGNRGFGLVDSPARNSSTIGVGALDTNDNIAEFSNYGIGTDIVAQGDFIYSTTWNSLNSHNTYTYNRGTSFAAPQVTATAALLLSQDSSLGPDQIKKRILLAANKLPQMGSSNYSTHYGYGKLDALNAITYDKIAPSISVATIKKNSSAYQLIGNIEDDIIASTVLPNTTTSNIGSARYRLDAGQWQTSTLTPAKTIPLDLSFDNISGQHTVTIEAIDTAGNKTSKQVILDTTSTSVSSNPYDYQAALVNQSSYPSIAPGQKTTMELSFRNTGNTVWLKDNVHLGASTPYDRISQFADSSWFSQNRIKMVEKAVSPGEIAHFSFTITAPPTKGVFREYFALVAEKVTWFADIGLYWDISIKNLSYNAQFISQSPYVSMKRGETRTLWVEYKNSGTQTWGNNVSLGTNAPQDRYSRFYTADPIANWKSPSRIKMDKDSVAPGETVRFSFTITAPNTTGLYYEYFRPVADGVTWMEDVGLYWQITVL